MPNSARWVFFVVVSLAAVVSDATRNTARTAIAQRGGRGGFDPFGGPRSNVRLAPEEIEFDDGVAMIPDRATFKKLSYQGSEVLIDTHLDGLEFVKFQIENAASDKPEVYFINTKTHRAHMRFMRAAGLPRGGRGSDDQMRGVLVYRPLLRAPSGQPGVYTFEFEPNDSYSFQLVNIAHGLLIQKAPIFKKSIGYYPMPGAMARYRREKSLFDAADFPVYLAKDLYADIGYLPLNHAESFGRLRLMQIDERPTARDIVLYKTLPNEMPRVAGIITGVRQTPLSHVNLRAVQDKVPNAFITNAWESPQIKPLLGKYVYYKVAPDGFELRAAELEEVETHFAKIRPAKGQTPARDLSETRIRPLAEIGFSDSKSVGVKAANVAALHAFGFKKGTIPSGFAIPFSFYDAFMRHNGLYETVERMLADPELPASADRQIAELSRLRSLVRAGDWPDELLAALGQLQSSFSATTPIRCRSSTNNEDLPGFSGAGLYDSFTHDSREGHIASTVKQVYASLWNYRAFEERQFYRIDHHSTAMGVLVHAASKGEKANGVAVTTDVVYQTAGYYYLNAQVGEELVTNPDESSVPEEVLLDWFRVTDSRTLRESDRVPEGQKILSSKHLDRLRRGLGRIHARFAKLYGRSPDDKKFAMEIEFKITAEGALLIKQARPWVF